MIPKSWPRFEHKLDRWIEVTVVKVVFRQQLTSAAVGIIVLSGFSLVGTFMSSPLLEIVEFIDSCVVVIVLLIGAGRSIETVWKSGANRRKGNPLALLAFAF